MTPEAFSRDLAEVINRHSVENVSNTPDIVLAGFLVEALDAFDAAVVRRTDLAARPDEQAQADRMAELEDELAGHRARQEDAENALILLLLREGGRVEFTPAEMTRAPSDGSFVSSRDVATGNEVLEFVAGGLGEALRFATAQAPTSDQSAEAAK